MDNEPKTARQFNESVGVGAIEDWLEGIIRRTNVAEVLNTEVQLEKQRAVNKAVQQERERVTKELGAWEERWHELTALLSRLQYDRQQRKAWLVNGDYQLLMNFIQAVENRSTWKLPKNKTWEEREKQ